MSCLAMQSVAQVQVPWPTPLVRKLMDPAFIGPFLAWSRRLFVNFADAEDVVATSRRRALAREARGDIWDPDGGIAAGRYFLRVVRGVLADRRKSVARRREDLIDDFDNFRSPDTPPDVEVADRLDANQRRRMANWLYASLVASGRDPTSARILEAVSLGITAHDDIAAHAGCTVEEMRAGLKRLGYPFTGSSRDRVVA
jgi:DNA-directed RNA polymerase specialized sigma24 family protein